MKRAVFVDRDGTLIQEKDYLSRPEDVILLPGTASGLRALQDAGFVLMMVTNQSGVGRGYFTMADVEAVHARLTGMLAAEGIRIEKIYVAPEAPDHPSRGRKPSPDFLFDAREEFGLDLSNSYMVGDKLSDIECGWNAGVQASVLVRTGYGAAVEAKGITPGGRLKIVDEIAAAARWIITDSSSPNA